MKKEELVAARLPRQLLKALQKIEEVEHSDRSATVRKLLYRAVADWKKDYAARLYGERKLTLERAAMEAEVGYGAALQEGSSIAFTLTPRFAKVLNSSRAAREGT